MGYREWDRNCRRQRINDQSIGSRREVPTYIQASYIVDETNDPHINPSYGKTGRKEIEQRDVRPASPQQSPTSVACMRTLSMFWAFVDQKNIENGL